MKILRAFIVLISIIAISCNSQIDKKTIVLQNQENNFWFPYNENKAWKPTESELVIADKIINQLIQENKSDFRTIQKDSSSRIYYKQLIAYLNKSGERIIYVNALCESFVKDPIPNQKTNSKGEINWENHFYDVDDGGNCFWQVQINIDEKEYFGYSVNGN